MTQSDDPLDAALPRRPLRPYDPTHPSTDPDSPLLGLRRLPATAILSIRECPYCHLDQVIADLDQTLPETADPSREAR
ncbi:MAG: hypothetical protein ACR2GH_00970 [Pseudonocardia sp.]